MLPFFHLQTSRDGDKHADEARDLAAPDALAFILEAIRAGCSINADDAIGALDFTNPHPDASGSPEWTHARLDLAPVADGAHEREQKRAEAFHALGVLAVQRIVEAQPDDTTEGFDDLARDAADLDLVQWDDGRHPEYGGGYAPTDLAKGTPDAPAFPTSKPTTQA